MLRLKLAMCFHSPDVGAKAVGLREILEPAPGECKRAMKPWSGGEPFNSQAFFQDLDLLARARTRPLLEAIFCGLRAAPAH